jgi:hypothetical protein
MDVTLPPIPEVVTIRIAASTPLAGSFSVKVGDQLPAGPFATSASASDVAAGLAILSNVVGVTGLDLLAGTPALHSTTIHYQFTFSAADGDVPEVTVITSGITAGNNLVASVDVTTPGAGPRPIKGSPWSVVVVPGATNAGMTTAAGPGLVTQVVGEPTTFVIQSKDDQGNNKLTTQARDVYAVDAFIPGVVSRTLSSGIVTPMDNGRYGVSFVPKYAGTYTIAVMLVTTPEVQTVSSSFGSVVGRGGSFVLTYDAVDTVPIAWDAQSAAVQAALVALPGLANAGLSVHAVPGGASANGGTVYTITFTAGTGLFGSITVHPSFASTLLPVGAGTGVTAAVTTPGVRKHIKTTKSPLRLEVQRILLDRGTGSGVQATPSFTLSYGGFTTAPLARASLGSDIKDALELLDSVGIVSVSPFSDSGTTRTWLVTFSPASGADNAVTFAFNFGDLPLMTLAHANLASDGRALVESVVGQEGLSPFSVLMTPAVVSGPHSTAVDEEVYSQLQYPSGTQGGLSTGAWCLDCDGGTS